MSGVDRGSGSKTSAPEASRSARSPLSRCADLLFLYVTFHLLYAATSGGDLTTDTQIRWRCAQQIVETGWFALEPNTAALYAIGVDGRQYIIWPLGQPVCLTPFVVAGNAIHGLGLPIGGSADMLGQFLATQVFFPCWGAIGLVLLYLNAEALGATRSLARILAITLGAATMHWQHTINTNDESQVAACLLLCLLCLQRGWRTGAAWTPLVAFAAAGAAMWFRHASVVISGMLLVTGFYFDLMAREDGAARLRRFGHWFVGGLVGLAPLVALMMWYNAVVFGGPFQTGYGPVLQERLGGIGLFETPILVGAAGMLFSPGKSVFLFNPPLIVAVIGLIVMLIAPGAHRRSAVVILAAALASVVFHSRYTTWAGDLTWGPRYLTSQIGLVLLGIIALWRFVAWRRVFWCLFAVSVAIQLASTIYSYGLEFFQDRRHGLIPNRTWIARESQLLRRFENTARHAIGRPNFDSIPPENERPELHEKTTPTEQVRKLHSVNLYPFKSLAYLGNRKLFAVLLAGWLLTIALLAATIRTWRRAVRASAAPPQP